MLSISDDVLRRLDVPGPRYTSYPPVPVWSERFGPIDHAAALARAAAAPDRPLSLYVHIPFCREMCTYCGCNVIATRDQRRADPYLDVLAREISLVAGHLGARRRLARLHLGGGTPTFLDEAQLERLWRTITAAFTPQPDAELAIEIDPVVTRPSQLALLASFGFRRISMGVQDFDPAVQRAVHRVQTVAETAALVDEARALGFRSVNFDLIHGLPRQTPESWQRTLDQVISLSPDRLAVFSFAYVPAARPNQRRLPIAEIPTGRAKLDLFLAARERLLAEGYRAIGMDHFARATDELAVAADEGRLWRDFQGYTTLRASDTVGLGVSAISDVGGAYVQSHKRLAEWERAVLAGVLPTSLGHRLDDDDRARRRVIVDLMCNGRVDLASAPSLCDEVWPALLQQQADGLLRLDGTRVVLTDLGRLFVRNVAMLFDGSVGQEARPVAYSRTV